MESRTIKQPKLPIVTRIVLRTLLYVVLSVGLTAMLVPVVWMLSASVKSNADIFTIPVQWIPNTFHFESYKAVIVDRPFLRWFANSAFVALSVTAANLLIASAAGYGFAKFEFPGKKVMFAFVLATFMIPLQVTMVPLFLEIRQFGWIDTYQGLIIPVMTDAFGVFLMRQFMMGIPNDYIEAARIDGANEIQIFLRIILPMSSSALAALGILSFMNNWDEFLWPLIVVSRDDLKTIPLGLASMQGIYQTDYNQLMAAAALAMVPLVVIFLLLKRWLMDGISISGLKM